MKWETIDKVLKTCRDDFTILLKSGQIPNPAGFSMRDKGGGQIGMHTSTCELPINSIEEAHVLLNIVRSRSFGTGASGFIAMMPRDVASKLLGMEFDRSAQTADFVCIAHAEHLHDGAKTWMLRAPYLNPKGDWTLVASGIATKVPACIDSRRYGPTRGSA